MRSKRFLSVICMMVILSTMSACKSTADDAHTVSSENESVAADSAVTEKEITAAEKKTAEISTDEDWGDAVEKDVEDTLKSLEEEYNQLKKELDTYEKYFDNPDKTDWFYEHVDNVSKELCIRLREYALEFAEQIVNSDKPYDEKYDAFEDLYDVIYDNAGDDIYDGIYDGILDDMYDDFYDGLLDDAYDNVDYSDWSDARSEEYKRWSNARSDAYEDWSDFRSDTYKFWSDMKSEMRDKDDERAQKKIEDFREDIENLKEKL